MNESELLFAKFFSEEKILISSMNDLELRAHRDELSKIAFEARARLTATDNEERERGAKRKGTKGFSASLQTDDITSDAINSINERQKKMSKQDKQIEAMVKMGVSREDAENMYKASTILALKKGELPGEKKKKTEIVKITGIACPECDHKYDDKAKGIMACPECKTIVEIIIPEDIRGKCPTCLNGFTTEEGIVNCVKCGTRVKVMKKAVNPFAKKKEEELAEIKQEDKEFLVKLANDGVAKEELAAIAENMIEQKKSFNPFKKG